MRSVLLGVLICLVGCNLCPVFILPPADLTGIFGGISDNRPYFGRASMADTPDREVADFLLASCGCGEWRAMVSADDGTLNASVVVQYYTAGGAAPTGPVTVHGQDADMGLRGVVDQDAATTEGRLEVNAARMLFTGARGENHVSSADACVMCHFGDDPVWPMPDTHNTEYRLDPPNCLDCHEAG